MVLSSEDFVALEVGWGPKSTAIGRISKITNIDPTYFAFLDDSRHERDEVRETFQVFQFRKVIQSTK